nr:cysteine-rich receptor-like protein kinase 3 [Quercus suber]
MPGSTMSFLGGLLVLAILLIILLIFQKYFKLAEVRKMVSPSERQQASASAKFSRVKKLSLDTSQQGEPEFLVEVRMITSIQHKNLVRLLGCCSYAPQRLLVYEYMQNRSLDLIVYGKVDQFLNWRTRFQIIIGIARGLQYLHEDSHLRIVHRDIKASNILLDDKFQPRIGDFGLARFFPEDQANLSATFAGTFRLHCT